MYKLTNYDKFQIEELIRKVEKYDPSEDIKQLNLENIYNKRNEEIAKFLSMLLDLWDLNVNNSYKPFSETESELNAGCRNIIKKLFTEDIKFDSNQDGYFSQIRIEELRNIKNDSFDLLKLIRILEEVNICYRDGCYLGISSLLRMLIDHIPPIFGKTSFIEVVNNHSFSKSDKKNMEHLLGSLKNISDSNLHTHIGKKEILPDKVTIEFRSDFDILLKNIIITL